MKPNVLHDGPVGTGVVKVTTENSVSVCVVLTGIAVDVPGKAIVDCVVPLTVLGSKALDLTILITEKSTADIDGSGTVKGVSVVSSG